jgi:hypothetical protein
MFLYIREVITHFTYLALLLCLIVFVSEALKLYLHGTLTHQGQLIKIGIWY